MNKSNQLKILLITLFKKKKKKKPNIDSELNYSELAAFSISLSTQRKSTREIAPSIGQSLACRSPCKSTQTENIMAKSKIKKTKLKPYFQKGRRMKYKNQFLIREGIVQMQQIS